MSWLKSNPTSMLCYGHSRHSRLGCVRRKLVVDCSLRVFDIKAAERFNENAWSSSCRGPLATHRKAAGGVTVSSRLRQRICCLKLYVANMDNTPCNVICRPDRETRGNKTSPGLRFTKPAPEPQIAPFQPFTLGAISVLRFNR